MHLTPLLPSPLSHTSCSPAIHSSPCPTHRCSTPGFTCTNSHPDPGLRPLYWTNTKPVLDSLLSDPLHWASRGSSQTELDSQPMHHLLPSFLPHALTFSWPDFHRTFKPEGTWSESTLFHSGDAKSSKCPEFSPLNPGEKASWRQYW